MNKLMSKAFLSVSLLFLSLTSVNAITKTIGGGGDYATLKAAFDAINNGLITGSIELQVQGNTTEAATPVLFANGAGSGPANYTAIKIYPTVTGLKITGNFDMTVDLNGANNVTFDGRLYNGAGVLVGAVPDLSVINTRTSASVSGIPMAAFRFRDGASNNTVKYCKISAKNSDQYILFSTSTGLTGNINNTIDHNDITNNTGRAEHAILALGSAGKENSGTISNNNIFNTWQLGAVSSSIEIDANNIGWTINNNSIYETAGYVCSQGNITIRGIYVSSTLAKDIHIQNNYIGGNSPLCVGTLTSTGASFRFVAMDVIVGATSVTKSDITGNTIKNFDYSTTSWPSDNNPWNGIFVSTGSTGDIDIVNNSIGDNTTTGSIVVNNNKHPNPSYVYGVYLNNNSGNILVDNNKIGSITCAMTLAGQPFSLCFEGILKTNTGGNITISNNLIGSTTIAKSIFTSSIANSSSGTQILYGIESQGTGVVNVNNNTIANLSNASTNAGNPNGASIIGVTLQNSSNYTVNNNIVRDLDIACNNTSGTNQSNTGQNGAIYGIYAGFENGGAAVARNATINDNQVFNLTNSYSSFGGNIYGIVCVDGGAGTPTVGINRNLVHSLNITGASSNSATATGILGVWNSSALNDNYSIANNIVYLNGGSKSSELYGINSDGVGANLVSYQYNTVYLEGSPASGSNNTKCLNVEGSLKYRIRNNILYNACDNTSGTSTAKHYALYLKGTTTAEVDYNLYYAPNKGGVLGYYGSDKTTYKIYPGKDAFSANYDPKFNNTGVIYTKIQPEYYQSCTPTQGTPVTIPVAINSDFGNVNPRNTPAVGAWENVTIGVPGTITGVNVICSAGNQTYSIAPVNGVLPTGYAWKTTNNWPVVGANNGSSITFNVPYNAGSSDTVSVTATGTCNGAVTSPASKLAVFSGMPPTPGAITGNTPQCSGSTSQTYKINAVKGAQTYNWTLPADWVITTPATGTNTLTSTDTLIVVTVGTISGNVAVSATNTCGTGAVISKNITVNLTPSVPTGPTTPVFCSSPTPRVSHLDALAYSGTSVSRNWYTVATGGTAINHGLYAFTTLTTRSYWVSITTNNCEGPRLKVDVTVNPSPSAPVATNPQSFCHTPQAQIANLIATPTGANSILWYAAATGGTPLLGTQNLVNGNTYYAAQSDGTCESSRAAVKAIIYNPQVPTVIGGGDTVRFCAGANPTVADFKLQLLATGGTPKVYTTNLGVVPMINTDPVTDKTSYFVTKDSASCESSTRHKITVKIADPAAPTGTSPQEFCQTSNPKLGKLQVTGTTVKWYAAASGGAQLDTATTMLVDGATYYASQTVGVAPSPTCESTTRLAVTATLKPDNIVSLTSVAGTAAQVLCKGDALVNIVYHVSGTLTGVTPSIAPALPAGVSSNWDGTAGDLTISGTPTFTQALKTYTVSLTGACGTSTKTFDITVNAVPAKPVVNFTEPACGAANVGTITVTTPAADGGITTFSIDGVDYSNTTGVFTNVAPSTYNVTAKAINCTSPATSVTINNQPPLPTAPTVGVIVQPTCAVPTATVPLSGLPVGAWTVTESVGSTTLNGTGNAANFTGLAAGKTYTFTVTSGSCTSLASLPAVVNVAPTPPAAPTVSSITQPTCTVATGTIVITTQAGVEYSVGGAYQASEMFAGLTPGNYTLSVRSLTDNTCVTTGTTEIINPQPVTPADPILTILQSTCASSANSITITNTATGNSYSIDGSDYSNTTGVFSNLAANTYSVTAKSSGGCVSNPVSATITAQPVTPAAPIVDTVQATCASANNSITIKNTAAGNTYSVDGVDYSNTSGVFTNLAANTYSVTAKSTGGCVSPATSVIIKAQPVTPADPILTILQSTCASSANSITITNTAAGNSYSIDGSDYSNTSGVFSNLAANTYSVTAKSSGGCVSNPVSATITAQPVTPAAPIVDTVQATCASANNSITIKNTAAGNTYSVDGVDYSNTSGVFTNLATNTYSVTAKSTGGCVSPATSVIIKPQPITPADPILTILQSTCASSANSITITNTAAGNSYSIDGSDYSNTSGVFNNLAANTYSVTAKSSGGCVSNPVSATISAQPVTPAAPTVGTITQPTCDVPTGSVSLSGLPTGSWTITDTKTTLSVTGNSTFVIIDKLNTGAHTFTVTNDAGCTSLPTSSLVINPVVNNTIVLTSTIGTDAQTLDAGTKITDITYKTTGAKGATFVELPSGVSGEWKDSVITIKGTPTAEGTFNYVITLTGGCGNPPGVGVIKVDPSEIGIPNAFSPNGDGTNDIFVIKKSPVQIIKLQVFSRWGTLVYEKDNYQSDWDGKGSGAMEGQDLLSGTYYYVIQVTTSAGSTPKEYTGYITLKR